MLRIKVITGITLQMVKLKCRGRFSLFHLVHTVPCIPSLLIATPDPHCPPDNAVPTLRKANTCRGDPAGRPKIIELSLQRVIPNEIMVLKSCRGILVIAQKENKIRGIDD